MSFFLFFIYVYVILYALKKEHEVLNSPSSPLFLYMMSNFLVLILYYLTSGYLGFHRLCFETVLVLLNGGLIFAIVSLFYTSNFKIQIFNSHLNELNYVEEYPSRFFYSVAFATIVFMILRSMSLGIQNVINSDEIASDYGGTGIGGHTLVLQIMLLAHLLGRKFSITSLPFIAGLVFCIFLYNVKAWIIVPVLIGYFIHQDLYKIKISPMWLIIVPLLIFCIFTISYMMTLGWTMDNMNFIWAHFCKYIYAGIGGLNESLVCEYPIGLTPLGELPSFINLLFGIDVHSASFYNYIIINDITTEWTNVMTLYGTLYLINGPFIGMTYLFFLAILSYTFYNIRLSSNNYWFYLAYYLWASGLILAFFGNYYKLLNIWEITIISYIIGIIKKNNNV